LASDAALGDAGNRLTRELQIRHHGLVRTLAEIERAADALPAHEKQELLLFLASRLRSEGTMPEPREFTKEQIDRWIAEDEAELREFKKQG
jgi:hypothetical protein